MADKVNTIIIGAGFSGLSAGIRLAQFQESVLILEAHTVPGGLNSFYFRGGRDKIFSSGLHTVTNFSARNRKWGFGLICRNLGISAEEFQLYPPKYPSKIITPDHELVFDNDLDVLRTSLVSTFPGSADAFEQYIVFVQKFKPEEKWFQLESRDGLRTFFQDEALIDLLELPVYIYGGYKRGQIDFVTFNTIFRSIFIEGCGSPPHVKHILDVLVKRFKDLGGQIKYRRRVKRLIEEQGVCQGVELANGDIIEADHIISSIGLSETGYLVDQKWGTPGEISCFETLVDLGGPLEDHGVRNTLFMVSKQKKFNWELPQERQSYHHLTLSALDNYAFDFEPPLHQLKIGCYHPGSLWEGLEKEAYLEEKSKLEAKMISELELLFPELQREHISYTESLTPNTVIRYTSHLKGTIYGGESKAFDGRTAINNLFIVGNDQGGIGIMGALTSGMVVANYQIILKP